MPDDLPTTGRAVGATLGTFALVCVAWVFFRATSFANALDVFSEILSRDATARWDDVALVGTMALATVAIDILTRRHHGGARPERNALAYGAGVGLAIVGTIVFSGGDAVPFVYFQF